MAGYIPYLKGFPPQIRDVSAAPLFYITPQPTSPKLTPSIVNNLLFPTQVDTNNKNDKIFKFGGQVIKSWLSRKLYGATWGVAKIGNVFCIQIKLDRLQAKDTEYRPQKKYTHKCKSKYLEYFVMLKMHRLGIFIQHCLKEISLAVFFYWLICLGDIRTLIRLEWASYVVWFMAENSHNYPLNILTWLAEICEFIQL